MANNAKPNHLKVLTGNPGQRPLPKETSSATGRPRPPANLKGEAFAEWCRVTDYLDSIGRIEKIDYAALIVYCTAWQTYESARLSVEAVGVLVEGREGNLVKNPAIQIMRDASATMLSFGGRFGFTPKDRVNLGITTAGPSADEYDDLLSGSA